MTRAFAYTQVLIVTLGALLLHLFTRFGSHENEPGSIGDISHFVAGHSLWFLLFPAIYAGSARILFADEVECLPLRITGFVMCAGLLVIFAIPLWHFLS